MILNQTQIAHRVPTLILTVSKAYTGGALRWPSVTVSASRAANPGLNPAFPVGSFPGGVTQVTLTHFLTAAGKCRLHSMAFLVTVFVPAGKCRLHSMASLVTVFVHAGKCRLHSMAFLVTVFVLAGKCRLHSMASLVTVFVPAGKCR